MKKKYRVPIEFDAVDDDDAKRRLGEIQTVLNSHVQIGARGLLLPAVIPQDLVVESISWVKVMADDD